MLVIPVKYGSSRLPKKNFLPFYNGLSLFQICCIRAEALGINPIIISSENPEICLSQLNKIAVDKSNYIIRDRPLDLARDPATIYDVVIDSIIYSGLTIPEKLGILLPTSPFNSVTLLSKTYLDFDPTQYSRLLSVSPAAKPPFNALSVDQSSMTLAPIFEDSPYKFMQSTRCPKAFFSNGCFSIYSKDFIDLKHHCKRPILALTMPIEFSLDIDQDFEFKLAQHSFENLADKKDLNLINSKCLS